MKFFNGFGLLNVEKQKFEVAIKKLGDRIKEIRTEQGMTQGALSSKCDIDIRTIQRIEKGQQNITLNILFSLCQALDIKSDELIRYSIED